MAKVDGQGRLRIDDSLRQSKRALQRILALQISSSGNRHINNFDRGYRPIDVDFRGSRLGACWITKSDHYPVDLADLRVRICCRSIIVQDSWEGHEPSIFRYMAGGTAKQTLAAESCPSHV
jgi:hypothetical protein